MKYIDESQWKNLLKEYYIKKHTNQNLPNKGVQFENLVEELLHIMFADSEMLFQPTKESHDGNKDFWALDEADELWWAECKDYAPNISLTQLAPTLIMAELNNARHIIFFSYSKLNVNLKRRIGQYSYAHKKEAIIYDDETLEEFLFKEFKDLPPFLLNNKAHMNLDCDIEVLFFNEKNPNQLDKKNFNGYYEIKKLAVGDIYDLNVIIINNSLPKTVSVFVEKNEDNLYFDFLETEESAGKLQCRIEYLKPNQLKLCKFVVRLKKYRDKLSLPKLSVKVLDEKKYNIPKCSPVKTYDCVWNKKDVFIGKHFENTVKRFEDLCIDSTKLSGFLVYGNGGTGKTRTLEECNALLLKNNYEVLNFIGFDTNSSWKDVVREIVYSVFAVSDDLQIDLICNMDNIVMPLISDRDKANILHLFKMLKENNLDEEFIESGFIPLFYKLQQGKYAIIVDNMQSYSVEILIFFKRMIQFMLQSQRKTEVILLFAVNTALVFDNKFLEFISEFERVGFGIEPIEGFNDELQAIAFLKTILKLGDYPLNVFMMKKILPHSSLKPKYIEQIANYIIQTGCVEIKDGKGIIIDPNQFDRELESIPSTFELLFSSTYQLILQKYPEYKDDFKKTLSMVHLFSEINDSILNVICLNKTAISILVKHNILIDIGETSNHIYSFEHDLVETCFTKTIYPDLLETAIQYTILSEGYNDYVFKYKKTQYYICGLFQKRFTGEQLKQLNCEIASLNIPNKFLYSFYFYFLNNLLHQNKEFSPPVFIEEVLNCCKYVRDHISEVDAEKLFSLAYPYVFDISLVCKETIKNHFSFVVHYCENKDRLKDVRDALTTYKIYQKKLSALMIDCPTLQEKIVYAQSYIDNRIFVCGKLEGKPDKYLKNLMRSLRMASKYRFQDILFENYFDAANLYFWKRVNIEKGIRLLERGFKCFYKMPSNLIDKYKVNYYSKCILYYLIKKDFPIALEKTSEALEYIEDNDVINYHLFFKCRYMKYKIVCLLLMKRMNAALDNAFMEYEKILHIINKRDDLELFFLQAKYAYFTQNTENYSALFEQFYQRVLDIDSLMESSNRDRDMIMLEELAVKYRMLFPAVQFQSINDKAEHLTNVNIILKMDEPSFQKYIDTYKSSAPILDASAKDGYFV